MLSLDLFNTVYERALNEGAVDDLEARRIHGLNTKMLELMNRAHGANSEMKAALKREYDKIKAERDSYYKIRSTNEAGLPDIADKQAKMAQLNQPGKAGSDAITPQQRVNPNPNKGIFGHAKDWLRGKGGPGKEGPTYESELSEEDELYKDIGAGYGVYNELLKAWEEKKPYIIIPMPGGGNLSVTRNQIFNVLFALKNMKDQQFKKTLQTAFSNLDKFMVWSNTIKRYQLPPEKPEPAAGGIAPGGKEMTQANLPLKERSNQKKNSKDIDTPQSSVVQRYLTKVRREAPNATSDIEAVAKHDLEQQTRTDKTISDLKAVNARQDQALKQAMSLDQQQGNEINDVESQLGQLSQKLQLIKTAKPAANQPVASTPTTPATTPAKTLSKTDTAQATQPARVPTETPVISIAEPANLSQKDQEIYTKVKDLETELKSKIDAMASWNKVAQKDDESRNELEMLRKDMERTKRELNHKIKQLKKSGAVTMEPRQNRQASLDLAPGNRRVDPSALLRQRLGQTLGTVDRPRELPVQPDLNILSQDDFNKLAGNLARTKQPVEVEEGQMSELDAMRQDLELMTDRQFSVAYGMSKAAFKQQYRTLLNPAPQQSTPVIDEHGGGIGPKQHWQDLMQENKLSVGDPVVVTGPNEYEGKTGEIYDFSPSGSFVIVDLYNHGKHSMHLSDIAYNEYADREQDDEDDWYDDEEDTLEESDNPKLAAIIKNIQARIPKEAVKRPEIMQRIAQMVQQADPSVQDAVATAQQLVQQYGQVPAPIQTDTSGLRKLKPGETHQGINAYNQALGQAPIYKANEGFQDFNKVEPYAVCLAGKPVKKFDYYEQARKFHDNWKQKLYREGNKAKADTITLMPLNLDEGARGDAIKQGYQAAIKGLTKQQNPYYKSVNGQTPPEAYDWEAGWEDARDSGKIPQGVAEVYTPAPAKPFRNPPGFNKQGTGVGNKLAQQTRAELAKKKQPVKEFAPSNGDNSDNFDPEMAAMAKKEGVVKGYSLVDHATVEQALEIPHCQWGDMYDGQYKQYFVKGFINGRKAKLEQARKDGVALTLQKDGRLARVQQGVAEDTDSWFRVTVKTPNGKNRNIQVPANSHGTAKRKALAYCAKNNIAGAEFVSAMRMPTLDEQGVAEAETDYSKRRQREKDVDAGKPVAKQREPRMTDYQKRRAEQKRQEALGEDQDTSGVEQAIIRRIMVAHTDLLMKFGPDKVMQAAEEVAYNVGDVDEIGTSDVSAYVAQVKQILGAV